jgi:hypothetical protein
MICGGIRGRIVLVVTMLLGALCPLWAAHKPPAAKTKTVDAGTFAVLVNGQQIATETFRIEQGASISTLTSEFKAESGQKTVQKAELQITSAGDLQHYEWHELSPDKAQIVVEPSDGIITEHITPAPPAHPLQQPFVLPPSTMVLDDYFFSQREVLLWRYLAQSCTNGKLEGCHPQHLQFGILAPQEHAILMVTLDYAGPETVKIGNNERTLNRFNLQTEQDPPWALYVDMDLKLVRIVIASEKTEIVRQ